MTAPTSGRADRQVKMSGYVRDQNKLNTYPYFTRELVERVERMPMPGYLERADRLLTAVAEKIGFTTGSSYLLPDPELEAISYSTGEDQILVLLNFLSDRGFIEGKNGACRILPEGYLRVEGLSSPNLNSYQGFVAMSFDKSMDETFANGFDLAIRAAGYKALRIDQKEHVNGISDEIIAEIRRSRFVVADYTQGKSGVYFEAGFAMGLGLLVIPTCRKDFVDQVHFDVRHINTLIWETPDQLRNDLAKRISAVIGDGPLRPPSGSA